MSPYRESENNGIPMATEIIFGWLRLKRVQIVGIICFSLLFGYVITLMSKCETTQCEDKIAYKDNGVVCHPKATLTVEGTSAFCKCPKTGN